MLHRLPRAKSPPSLPPPSPITYKFRALRRELEEEGWFKRSMWQEAKLLLQWLVLTATGVLMARAARQPGVHWLVAPVAVLALACGNTVAGWLAHDFVHGRGWFPTLMRPFGELVGGMSTTWWSSKHNMHHALTNEVGYDEDISLEPLLFLWAPDPKNDSRLRAIQHLYWPLPFSLLFIIWRVDSLRVAFGQRLWGEAARLVAHWAIFMTLVPTKLLLLSVWLSGLLTATIVTATHQSEEMFMNAPESGETSRKYEFVEAQFRATRNARLTNPLSAVMWGGMEWQLEHHLFPQIPKYKYPQLAQRLRKFAADNALPYKESGELEILAMNVGTLARVGQQSAQEGNPDSTPMNRFDVKATTEMVAAGQK